MNQSHKNWSSTGIIQNDEYWDPSKRSSICFSIQDPFVDNQGDSYNSFSRINAESVPPSSNLAEFDRELIRIKGGVFAVAYVGTMSTTATIKSTSVRILPQINGLTTHENLLQEENTLVFVDTLYTPLEFDTDYEVKYLIKKCEEIYSFVNKDEINVFFKKNKCLIEILSKGYEQIKSILKDDFANVTLEYEHDPEEDFEGLFVTVLTSVTDNMALEYLEKLEDEWLLKLDREITKDLFINVVPL